MSKTTLYEGSYFNSPKLRETCEQSHKQSTYAAQSNESKSQDYRVEGVFNLACDCKPTK